MDARCELQCIPTGSNLIQKWSEQSQGERESACEHINFDYLLYVICSSAPGVLYKEGPPGKTLASLENTHTPEGILGHGSVHIEVCMYVLYVHTVGAGSESEIGLP